eukprot:gb/GECG01004995.1/.p1 GENE.gb/GECG01004995.1/~~gb/GECG01004995.1/.p1  ORF type:complete len:380 (+),score=43.95 gb/GECG01004995.1/:1-1140(+)
MSYSTSMGSTGALLRARIEVDLPYLGPKTIDLFNPWHDFTQTKDVPQGNEQIGAGTAAEAPVFDEAEAAAALSSFAAQAVVSPTTPQQEGTTTQTNSSATSRDDVKSGEEDDDDDDDDDDVFTVVQQECQKRRYTTQQMREIEQVLNDKINQYLHWLRHHQAGRLGKEAGIAMIIPEKQKQEQCKNDARFAKVQQDAINRVRYQFDLQRRDPKHQEALKLSQYRETRKESSVTMLLNKAENMDPSQFTLAYGLNGRSLFYDADVSRVPGLPPRDKSVNDLSFHQLQKLLLEQRVSFKRVLQMTIRNTSSHPNLASTETRARAVEIRRRLLKRIPLRTRQNPNDEGWIVKHNRVRLTARALTVNGLWGKQRVYALIVAPV